jgi:hypothetical protein
VKIKLYFTLDDEREKSWKKSKVLIRPAIYTIILHYHPAFVAVPLNILGYHISESPLNAS